MRFRYETGAATFTQFVVTTLLTFVTGIYSIVGSCTSGVSPNCVSNTLVSLILIILIVLALGVLLVLGYAAQERRSSRLAKILIALEVCAGIIYLFDAQHTSDIINRSSDLIACLLALWVIILAWRLARAKGGRIVKLRRRRHSL